MYPIKRGDDDRDDDRYDLIPVNRNIDRESDLLHVSNWPPHKHRELCNLVLSADLSSKHSQLAKSWLICCPEERSLTIDQEISTGGRIFRKSLRMKTTIRRY